MRPIDADCVLRFADVMEEQNKNKYLTPKLLRYTISKFPTLDVKPVKHGEWLHTDKHLWLKNKHGEIDEWAWELGFHNGVECEVCMATLCVNCKPDYQESTCPVGHYYCSQCGEVSKDAHEKFCPECGAKMDGGKTDGE